jgi:hypothetical protein
MDSLRELDTVDLVNLHNVLCKRGGPWLARVRTALNWRTIWDGDYIRANVDPFSWDCISGRSR